jgi:hypothetical protein
MQTEPDEQFKCGVGKQCQRKLDLPARGEPAGRLLEMETRYRAHFPSSSPGFRPRFLRIDSPLSSMR